MYHVKGKAVDHEDMYGHEDETPHILSLIVAMRKKLHIFLNLALD
jgi:hypothetical protein